MISLLVSSKLGYGIDSDRSGFFRARWPGVCLEHKSNDSHFHWATISNPTHFCTEQPQQLCRSFRSQSVLKICCTCLHGPCLVTASICLLLLDFWNIRLYCTLKLLMKKTMTKWPNAIQQRIILLTRFVLSTQSDRHWVISSSSSLPSYSIHKERPFLMSSFCVSVVVSSGNFTSSGEWREEDVVLRPSWPDE